MSYKKDIIKQLISFGIGTRNEIISAMDNVVNSNDINEITNYLIKNQHKQFDSINVRLCHIYIL